LLGRPGLRGGETKAGGDGFGDLAERRLAAFDIHESAGRRFRQRKGIKRRDIGDMHIRPTVQPTSDVRHHTGCLGLAHKRRNLHALRWCTQGFAVDHRAAEHDRADAGGIEDQPVDRDAGGFVGCRFE
jgi:hypothetical protein